MAQTFVEIPVAGSEPARVDPEDRIFACFYTWKRSASGRVVTARGVDLATTLLHKPAAFVDGNPLNCTRENLKVSA